MASSRVALKIGVFDSGLGGRYIARHIKSHLPNLEILLKTDRARLPYGHKSPDQLVSYLKPVIAEFETQGVEAIVIACNTVTTNILPELQKLTELPLIGVEPPLDIASDLSQSGTIAICATDGTLSSQRYRQLKAQMGHLKIIEPNCSDWAGLIEAARFGDKHLKALTATIRSHGADVVVLYCTHYLWFASRLRQLDKNLTVIGVSEQIVEQLQVTLAGIQEKQTTC